MKNKKITVYDLLGLIKAGKAPKKIKDVYGIYELNKSKEDYEKTGSSTFLYVKFGQFINTKDFLDYKVEIIEENDEWEDIEEYNIKIAEISLAGIYSKDYFISLMQNQNHLIRNQKYLKAQLEKNKGDVSNE